jgi:hypothetical protein
VPSFPTPLQASVTLYLENQNNGQRGATIHHETTGQWFCPVRALVRQVSDILTYGYPPQTPLSYISPGKHVTSSDIVALIRHAARFTNLQAQGYNLTRVESHSLGASGAMALKLSGENDSTIMKIGRWTGSTFIMYIQTQIGALNAGCRHASTSSTCSLNGKPLATTRPCSHPRTAVPGFLLGLSPTMLEQTSTTARSDDQHHLSNHSLFGIPTLPLSHRWGGDEKGAQPGDQGLEVETAKIDQPGCDHVGGFAGKW